MNQRASRSVERRLLGCGVLVLAVIACAAPCARAGTYAVHGCWGSETDGWTPIASQQWGLDVRRGCPWQQAPSLYAGLHAFATKRAYTQWSQIGWVFTPPPNTRAVGISADAAVVPNVNQIPGHAWTRGVWDADTGAWLGSVPGTVDWTPSSFQSFSAGRLAIGLRCYTAYCGPVIQASGPNGGNNTADWVSFLNISVTVRDDDLPRLSATQPPPAGWIGNASAVVQFTASDNVGVSALFVSLDGVRIGVLDRRCYDPSSSVSSRPCADASPPLALTIGGERLVHGRHTLALSAVDAAGNIATREFPLLVDHNAPAAPRALALHDGTGWRATNRFEVSWTNPPSEGESAVGRADYELCPAANRPYDESGCRRGERIGDGLARISDLEVPSDGEWRLRVSLRDAAGNGDGDRAATVDGLRLDTGPPSVAFAPVVPTDPTRIRVIASDRTSGIASVEVEARRRGETIWRSLPVYESADAFTAIMDDEQLPDGMYDFRARAVDRAGNDRTTMLLGGGTPFELILPVRAGMSLDIGRSSRIRVKGSRGKRPRYRRVLIGRPRADYGSGVTLQGRLVDTAGNPRTGAAIDVLERVDLPATEWRFLATVHADAIGTFVFRALPGAARVLRFRYAGTATTRPTADEVEMRVRAGVTLVPSRGRVRNGQSVLFRGRLLGEPVPAEGKLLALQALTSRGWRTFATPRARGADGRWSYRYRFTGTTTTVRYAFRVVAPAEVGYPYAQGASRVAHVVVRGA
jgi:hypothetical protein